MHNSFTTKIKQLSNTSLGIRIPAEQCQIYNYTEGDTVQIIISKVIIPTQEVIE